MRVGVSAVGGGVRVGVSVATAGMGLVVADGETALAGTLVGSVNALVARNACVAVGDGTAVVAGISVVSGEGVRGGRLVAVPSISGGSDGADGDAGDETSGARTVPTMTSRNAPNRTRQPIRNGCGCRAGSAAESIRFAIAAHACFKRWCS